MCELAEAGKDTSDCSDFEAYLVTVDLGRVADEKTRERLKHVRTSFKLKPTQVDELREAARTVLRGSDEFQRFLDTG
jgi:hypothetical protein